LRKKNMALIAVLGVAALAAGCGSNSTQPAPNQGGGTPAAAAPPQVYTQNCAACHGQKLEGVGTFPKLADVGARLSEEQIKNTILKGKGAMPAFDGKLKPEEVTELTKHLASRK
jgi:cytochrome c551